VRGLGVGGFSLLAARWPAMAGPFSRDDFDQYRVTDKM